MMHFQARTSYYPIDALLEMPRVRVLRTLKHFDWATSEDVKIALDALDDIQTINTFAKTLERLVKEQLVERSAGGKPHLYRITASGERHLALLLARSRPR